MVTIPNQTKDVIPKLLIIGFVEIRTKTSYELARLISNNPKATAILYSSGKLLIQGTESNQGHVMQKLGLKIHIPINTPIAQVSGLVVGSDETLKGDTFGGLVVAGVLCDDITREKLSWIVSDSKKIDDKNIPLLAEKIKQIAKYSIKNVYPIDYNNHSQTELMNLLHRQVFLDLNTLSNTSATHIVDKYPGCSVGDIRETKAEDKYVEVAAASIIARDEGLKQLDELTRRLGIQVPKGSTHVKHALEYLKNSKKNPKEFVKLHFKNVQAALL